MVKEIYSKTVKGLTLLELLVSIGLLAIVGGIAAVIFFITIMNASKSDTIREVKQNGDYAISVMERMIRGARIIEDPASCSGTSTSSITIRNPDNQPTTFSVLSGPPDQVASNSTTLTNNKVKVNPGGLTFTCTQNSGKAPIVSINLSLSQAGTTTKVAEITTIIFKTTVSLRTY